MRTPPSLAATLLVAALALPACGARPASTAASDGSAPAASAASAAAAPTSAATPTTTPRTPSGGPRLDVVGRRFASAAVEGHELVEGTVVRLAFGADGALAASAGCNQLSGAYRLDGGVLGVDDVASTRRGCEAALAEQDAWLEDVLTSSPALEASGDGLVLASGAVRLTFQPDA